jgi:hypothetical protein
MEERTQNALIQMVNGEFKWLSERKFYRNLIQSNNHWSKWLETSSIVLKFILSLISILNTQPSLLTNVV